MLKTSFVSVLLVLTGILTVPLNAKAHSKFWAVNTMIGPLSEDQKIKYYIEEQVRFIDSNYKFNQFFFMPAVGYQVRPNITLFSGVGLILSKEPSGEIVDEYRLWEQISWRVFERNALTIDSRTRLEERKNADFSSVAMRFRERVWARVPLTNQKHFFLSLFDEIFFNINHPVWVSPTFFEQNRAFIGLSTKLSKFTILDVGYLNQYLVNSNSPHNHVILASLSITM